MFRNADGTWKKKNLAILAGAVATVVLLTVLVAVLANKSLKDGGVDRIECPGFSNKPDCESHSCSYSAVKRGPYCYMTKDSFGYKRTLENVVDKSDGKTANLISRTENTPYGPAISNVLFQADYVTENIVRIKLTDKKNTRYEVPVQKRFPLLQQRKSVKPENLAYEVITDDGEGLFTFKIRRKSDNQTLWDTSIGGLVMSDQFLQIASYLPSKNIYGLGEATHSTLRHNTEYYSWPMFARDRFPIAGRANLYGVHPFYTCLEDSSKSHGVLLLNSNAMEATVLPAPAISFRTIGGILDLFFFVGDSPEHVVQLYTSLIGRPMMPPYWGLGFQLSRYGYNSLDKVKAAVERTRNASIAQDVQFLDIDHMDGNRDFTYNKKEFADLINYMKQTKDEQGLKWIIILDPAIEAAKDYAPYENGLKSDVFIRRAADWKDDMFPDDVKNSNVTYGKVWPSGIVAFPDFLNAKAQSWWKDTIKAHHDVVPFDGLWIDMNEPSNFDTNSDRPWYCAKDKPECWSLKCPKSKYEDPPYNPLASSGSSRLSTMTLCMDSVQYDGEQNYRHFDVHSLYGWSQAEPTLKAGQESTGSRSLVISRSTYPSSGRYTGHWLGDNKSTWDDLRNSIIGMLEFNLFGIPYIGADVCGFFDTTTDELCARWMQLGAFYPFYRNHNGMGEKDQDPAALGNDVLEASQKAVERRYTLLPYLYTLFYRAHVDGSTVLRPLMHEFPTDENTIAIDEQFMWGKSLLISPVVKQGQTRLRFYLPKGEWWLLQSANETHEHPLNGDRVQSRGEYRERWVRVTDNIPVYVRGGSIIPTEPYSLKRPFKLEKQTIDLFIYVQDGLNGTASGELYFDDGLSIDPIENKKYGLFKFTYNNCELDVKNEGPLASQIFLGYIFMHAQFNERTLQTTFAANEFLPDTIKIDLSKFCK